MCDLPKVCPKLTTLPLERVTILLLHDQNRIYTVFKELAMECRSDGLLEELFEIIADSVAAGDILTTFTINPSVEKAIAFIEMNILDPITLDMICDSVGVKKCTLYNLFLSNLMLAPTRYIRAKRMALAKMMLNDDLTTQKYLNYCGFENTEVFEDAYENFYRSIP